MRWLVPPDRVLDDGAPPFYRWFTGGELNTCDNALDRHVEAGPRRPARAHLRQPRHRHAAHATPTASCATRSRGSPGRCGRWAWSAATAWSSTCRWCPRRSSRCWRARGSAPCTRSCSAGSRRRSWPPASTTPGPRWSCRRRAASRASRVVAYKPLLDQALELAAHQVDSCVILQREQAARRPGRPARRRLGRGRRVAPARRVRAGRRHRPALHPVHVGHDRAPEGRRPRQRRARGRAALVDGERLRRRARRRVLGRVRRRVGRRPLLHRVRAAAGRLHDRAVRGQAGRHPGRGRVLAGRRRAPGQGAVHRADRDPRDQEGGPGGRAARRARPVGAATRCSSPASASTPTPTTGRRASSAAPSSTTGGRPRPAGRSRRTCAAWSPCRSSPAPRRVPVPGYDVRVLRAGRHARAAGRRGRRSRSGCRCRPARCRRCGRTTSGSSSRTCPVPRATT